MTNKNIMLAGLTTMLLSLTACVDTEKNKLENRAQDYWDLKTSRNFKEAYDFLSPGWKKTETQQSFEQRMLMSKVIWKKSSFKNKDCAKKDLCEIEMEIVYEYNFKGAGNQLMKVESNVKETWIMKDNKWYHLPIEKKLNQ